ncbi:MAG: hypothetical protein OXC07_03190 [Kistimonas sp.]|nr:hypothetical protein [Kistimonas sp.]
MKLCAGSDRSEPARGYWRQTRLQDNRSPSFRYGMQGNTSVSGQLHRSRPGTGASGVLVAVTMARGSKAGQQAAIQKRWSLGDRRPERYQG